jgi:hypothetical protein
MIWELDVHNRLGAFIHGPHAVTSDEFSDLGRLMDTFDVASEPCLAGTNFVPNTKDYANTNVRSNVNLVPT